jgi:hypothetical protein
MVSILFSGERGREPPAVVFEVPRAVFAPPVALVPVCHGVKLRTDCVGASTLVLD